MAVRVECTICLELFTEMCSNAERVSRAAVSYLGGERVAWLGSLQRKKIRTNLQKGFSLGRTFKIWMG